MFNQNFKTMKNELVLKVVSGIAGLAVAAFSMFVIVSRLF